MNVFLLYSQVNLMHRVNKLKLKNYFKKSQFNVRRSKQSLKISFDLHKTTTIKI